MTRVLIAEDEKVTRLALARILEKAGMKIVQAADGKEALELFRRERPAAVILDIMMPVMNGLDTIRQLKDLDASVPVIIATGRGDISSAVDTMKLGAYDFLVKPIEPGKLIMTVRRAIEKYGLEQELSRLHTAENASLERFMGKTPAMKKIAEQLTQVAGTDFSVVIQGETGTGKSLLAKILHNVSRRAAKKFVKIDLASMPETIIESELFGYEKGAFTGAVQPKQGFFEAADGGTAFLDDLENITPTVQAKLLGVLESRETCRLGSRKSMSLDIRFIAATNTDIQKSVQAGIFREDLFYRMGEFIITLPPLRERTGDLPFFINVFLDSAVSELNISTKTISPEAIERMVNHTWPGNLRELKNVVRRAALLSGSGEIRAEHVEFLLGGTDPGEEMPLMPLRQAVDSVEKKLIAKTLEATKGNRARAAELLQIDIKTLRTKMTQHSLK